MVSEERLHEKGFDIVVVSVGSNDGPSRPRGKEGQDHKHIASEIMAIATAFERNNTRVRILGVLPRGDRRSWKKHDFFLDDWGRKLNRELTLRTGPGCSKDRMIAFYATERYFCTYHGVENTPFVQENLFSYDGVHLSHKGKMAMVQVFYDLLHPFLDSTVVPRRSGATIP